MPKMFSEDSDESQTRGPVIGLKPLIIPEIRVDNPETIVINQ